MNAIRNPNQLLCGFALVALGVIGLWLGRNLQVGSTLRMGPGWMPNAMCFLLILFGVLLGARSFVGERIALERWAPRPLVFVLGAIGFFALAVERLGLVVAVLGLVLIAALGDRETRWKEAVVVALALAIAASLLFVKVLALPIPVWPRGL